jgi:hypothetical protein
LLLAALEPAPVYFDLRGLLLTWIVMACGKKRAPKIHLPVLIFQKICIVICQQSIIGGVSMSTRGVATLLRGADRLRSIRPSRCSHQAKLAGQFVFDEYARRLTAT